jgi:O-antigen ligase
VLLVVGIAFGYLLLTRRRTLVLPLSASAALLALYGVVSIASWIFTRAPGSTKLVGDLVAYSLMAVLAINLVQSDEQHRGAWTAFLVSALLIAVLGAFLYYAGLSIWRADPDHLGRLNVTFGDPNISARFFNLAICAAILMNAARQSPAWLSIATIVVASAIFPLTFSKSGYAIFIITVLLVVPLAIDRRRAAAMAGVALVVFAVAIAINTDTRDRASIVIHSFAPAAPSAQSSTGSTPSLAGGTIDPVRSYLISAGWQMFRDHPLTGVGFGGFQHALVTTYERYVPANPPATLSHTSAITMLSEQGLIGAGIFSAFLVLLFWEMLGSIRRRAPERLWVVMPAVLIVPIVAYSQFEGRFIEEPYLWLAIGLFFAARALESPTRAIHLGA